MSNVSDRHNVNPFVAGKSAALTGQRLAKVGYKSTKKQKAKFPSVCVSVPPIVSDSEEFNQAVGTGKFDKIIIAALENAQDGIIKSLYESAEGNLSSVSDSEICIDACLAYIDAEMSGGRMTKEFLESWFVDNVQDNLSVALCERTGMNLDDPKIGQAVNGFKGLISGLSGGKTFYSPEQITQVRKALELSSEDDEVSKKLNARLDTMEKKTDELVLNL